MKTVSAGLSSHLELGTTTLCTCWKITLADATVKGFTDHDRDLVVSGVTYLASSGYTPSAVQTSSALNVDNLELDGVLQSPSITPDELNAGAWDFATVEIFMVNWADLTMGVMHLRKGRLGEVTAGRSMFKAELRGLMQAYSRTIGELYSPACRADLYDARCAVNPAAFTFAGTVGTVSADNRSITDAGLVNAAGYFDYGKITFTSGLNNGLSMEVKTYTVGSVALQLPMPYLIVAADTFSIKAGCDKSLATCKAKFSNVVNMRAEPHLPGQDALMKVGGR